MYDRRTRGRHSQRNLTKLKQLIRLQNLFRRFVLDCARMVATINRKNYKNQPSTFETLGVKEKNSLNTLKNATVFLPVFALPNSTRHMKRDTDSCDVQVKCVVIQKLENITKTVAYWSQSLTDTKRK